MLFLINQKTVQHEHSKKTQKNTYTKSKMTCQYTFTKCIQVTIRDVQLFFLPLFVCPCQRSTGHGLLKMDT